MYLFSIQKEEIHGAPQSMTKKNKYTTNKYHKTY